MGTAGAPEQDTAIMPYLFFGGRCEEAIAFYQQALGARLEQMMRFRESPEPHPPGMVPDGWGEKVMHASFRVHGALILASDGMGEKQGFKGFSLTLTVKDEAEANRAFTALADGGAVRMPLARTFWSPCFGMVADRFGVEWMVMVPAPMGEE